MIDSALGFRSPTWEAWIEFLVPDPTYCRYLDNDPADRRFLPFSFPLCHSAIYIERQIFEISRTGKPTETESKLVGKGGNEQTHNEYGFPLGVTRMFWN